MAFKKDKQGIYEIKLKQRTKKETEKQSSCLVTVTNSATVCEKIAKEILINFNIELNYKNIEYVISKVEEYRGGRKREKVVGFDMNGNQICFFNSITEMAIKEKLKYKSASNIIKTGGVCRKTGLRYRKMSEFGNFKHC